jgi:hypothetical protein
MGNIVGIIAVVFIGLLVLGKCNKDKPLSKEAVEFNHVWNGKEKVRSMLKDGDSALFKNDFTNNVYMDGKSITVSCGWVNSKNSFGAYSGFQRYVAAGSAIAGVEEQIDGFDEVWTKLCVK